MLKIGFEFGWVRDLKIYVRDLHKDGTRDVYEVKLKKISTIPAGEIAPPSMVLDFDKGEMILDALVKGLREAKILQGEATDAELKATKYHLEDMRKLAMLDERIE